MKNQHHIVQLVIILCLVFTTWMFYPRLSRIYFVHVRNIPKNIRPYILPTSACIPAEHALAFIDSNNIAGFILFEKMEYSQVDYVVKMFDQQTEKIQKGRLTTWKKWPWSKHSLRSAHVYIGDEEYPHFAWLPPFCFLHFDRSKILKVCLVPLNKVHEALENKDSEQWIDTDYIGNGVVGRGNSD